MITSVIRNAAHRSTARGSGVLLAQAAAARPNLRNLPTSSWRNRATTYQPAAVAFTHASSPRLAANPNAGKPGSDSLAQAAQNIKEESKKVKSSIESAIAGTHDPLGASSSNILLNEAKSITGEMAKAVPQPALLWGAAGAIPYVSTAGASIYLARQANLVASGLDSHIDLETAQALLYHAQQVQISYGAVILSFLGAIHWGFEFAKYGGVNGNRRYLIGILPAMLAWPTLSLSPQLALISQWGAYVVAWFIDLRATTAGWVPRWYSTYRFWLTFAVGTSIIATLAGTNYYTADVKSSAAQGTAGKLYAAVKADAREKVDQSYRTARGQLGGKVLETKLKSTGEDGELSAELGGQDADGFVVIKKRHVATEEDEEGESKDESKDE